MSDEKLRRSQKRAAQERAKKRRSAFEEAQRNSGLLNQPLLEQEPVFHVADAEDFQEPIRQRTLQRPEEVEVKQKKDNSYWKFAGSLLLASLGLMAAFGLGAPVLGHEFVYGPLIGGIVIGLVGLTLAWRFVSRISLGAAFFTSALSLFLVSGFVVGALTSVVINDKVYLTTSATAQAYRLSNSMLDDLEYMRNADELLTADQTQGRARFKEYVPTARRLSEISAKWSKVADDPGSLPSPALAEIARSVAVATDWHSRALTRKSQVLVEPDARGEAEIASYRASGVQQFSLAGVQLGEIAKVYGFELGVKE